MGVFFSYYGSKFSRTRYYPPPRHRTIVEAFAGSAGYSVNYPNHDVRLYETDHRVVGVWEYLIRVRGAELRALPSEVTHLDNHPGLVQEARWLIGFWLCKANATPRPSPSTWAKTKACSGSYWGQAVRDRLAVQVECIRHWRVYLKSYHEVPDIEATYYVDPPYSGRLGRHYTHSRIDYEHLSGWCQRRRGQVVACEHAGATWLPFEPLGPTGIRSAREVVWTNAA